MPVSKPRRSRAEFAAAVRAARGGVILGNGPAKSHKVRNAKGGIIPCVWAPCWKDGDTRHQLTQPNPDAPSPHMPGGKIIRVFCSREHLELFAKDAEQMRRDQAAEQARLRRR